MWSETEAKELKEVYGAAFAKDGQDAAVRAVAIRAIELAATRSGTMTVLQHAELARMAAEDVFLQEVERHMATQGATVATLQAKVGELEKARETYAKESGSFQKMHAEAFAEVERLKAGHDARCGACGGRFTACSGCLRTALERADAAESRLAAIRERVSTSEFDRPDVKTPSAGVLEGDAPQECQHENPTFTPNGCGQCIAERMIPIRYPCSATCTHDDAANPGHPERVKAQSVAVARAALGLPDAAGAEVIRMSGGVPAPVVASEEHTDGYNAGYRDALAIVEERVRNALDGANAQILAAIEGAAP